jgi:hypothetical protein
MNSELVTISITSTNTNALRLPCPYGPQGTGILQLLPVACQPVLVLVPVAFLQSLSQSHCHSVTSHYYYQHQYSTRGPLVPGVLPVLVLVLR